MKIYKRTARSYSYAAKKRNRKTVQFIVIHYTGVTGDTAKNNADYFATGNTRAAGAHFFVDQKGNIARSIPMNRIAYAVGGDQRTGKRGEAKYFGRCTNANSISIELCDNADKMPSKEQIKAVRALVKYIRRYCPNAKTIIRHFDVNGKICPAKMLSARVWKYFREEIEA